MLTTREIPDSSPPALDQSDQLIRGVFEPPSSFVLSAISRNKWIVLLFAIALALVGFGIGRSSKNTYTASATLQVGQVNPNSPGFYGYVQSAASLATAFSRSISSEPVLATVQHKLNLAPSKAISRLSAEPIPQAPAFRVIATGPTEYAAIQLANVASGAVIAYEGQSNSANPEAESLLSEYRAASVRLQHDGEALAHIFHRVHGGSSTPKSVLVRIEADRNADAARYRAIGAAYNAAIASQAPRSGLVSLLAGATSASSNRSSKTELFGFLGLLIGVVVGCSVAVLRERLRTRVQSRGAMAAAEMQRPKPDLA
jgi:capsular polysaccharide biosynthesis protein